MGIEFGRVMPWASLVALLLWLAVLGAASSRAASWLPPQNVFSTPVMAIQSDPFFNRKALQVASDTAGNSIAVWIEQHAKVPGPGTECQAMWAIRPAGGSFAAPQSLAPAMPFCAGQIDLAMNGSGTAVAAWKQGADIDAAILSPGEPFAAATTLSASTATDDPWVSINSAGVAAVSWDDTNTGACAGLTPGVNWAFHASVRQPGGGFGPFETVCDAPHPIGPTIFTPRVDVDPQGDVVATWVNSFNDETHSHVAIEAAYRSVGGTFTGTTPQVLREMTEQPGASGSYAADIAVDSLGRATAVWPFFNGAKIVIETAVRPAGASAVFSAPGPVSDPVAPGDSNSPRVAVDPASNTAVAVWVQCPSSCQVEGAARASGAGFQVPQGLSAPGASSTFGPLVAFDPSGEATAVWSGPSPDVPGTQVQVTRRPPGAVQSFGEVTTISSADPSLSPAVAFDGEGNGIAVWEHDTTAPTAALIQYAGLDAAPPEIQAVSAPNGVVGRPVSFSANVFDRWSTPTVMWGFGDGATANGSAVSHAYTTPGTYRVAINAVDAVGNQRSAEATITILCPPPPNGTTLDANCNAVGVRPTITHVAQAHAVWREGVKVATLARRPTRRPPIGTTFTFSLNTSASVSLVFTQTVDGRRVAGKCVAATKRAGRRRTCKRTVTAGTLTFANAHSGIDKVVFQGRLSRSRRLRPGRYALTITAANTSGRAVGTRLTFTIVNH
jgi:hypothetical protein